MCGVVAVCSWCVWCVRGLLDMFVVYSRSWCAWRGRGVRGMLVHGARVIGLVICLNSWFTRVRGDDRGYGHELCMYR